VSAGATRSDFSEPPTRGMSRRVVAIATIVAMHALALIALNRYTTQPRPSAPQPPGQLSVAILPPPPPLAVSQTAPTRPVARPVAAPPVPAPSEIASEAPAPPTAAVEPPPVAQPQLADGAGTGASVPAQPNGERAVTAEAPDEPAITGALAVARPEPARDSEPPSTPQAAGDSTSVAPPPVLPPPQPVARRFRVFFGDYHDGQSVAELAYSLEIADGRYRLQSQARAVGLTALFWSGALTQQSTGRIGPQGLEPERYTEQRGRRPERWASADRVAGTASFSGGERAALPPGTQDRLSVLVQLGLIARAQPQRLLAGRHLDLPEFGNRAIATVRYVSLGDEVLATDEGQLRTLHLRRQDGDSGRATTIDIWLGYDQGLMPVRIRLTDPGGRVLDQILVP
jgi:hypothetical protein